MKASYFSNHEKFTGLVLNDLVFAFLPSVIMVPENDSRRYTDSDLVKMRVSMQIPMS